MNQPENAIVVAVPAVGGDAALTFAVEEARRSGSPLHLVHVLQLPGGEPYATVYERRHGRRPVRPRVRPRGVPRSSPAAT